MSESERPGEGHYSARVARAIQEFCFCATKIQKQISLVARSALDKVPLQVARGLATNLAHRARV